LGVSLRAPRDWSPVAVSAEGQQGYLKVVSPDTRYLELKWEKPKGVISVPDALEKYLGRLERTAKKSRTPISIRRRVKGLTTSRPAEQAPIGYAWEADRKAEGCIWHCGDCGRLVIAELVGDPDDDLTLAQELLNGIQDHGDEGWNTWALYGLTVRAPEGYSMEKHTLMTGHQRFQLRHGGATLEAQRWGLAEIALRGTTVREWFEQREAARLRRYAYRVEDVEVNGHPGHRLSGRDRVWFGAVKALRAPATMVWPRFFVQGYVWRCPEANRIFAVLGEQSRRSDLVSQVVGRMRCHPV
jgi:hypothetical protein